VSLSDLDDEKMRDAKKGQFYLIQPQRAMANNSAVYNEKPSATQFMEEWLALAKSGTGERGIFNRGGLKKQLPQRRWDKFKKHWQTSGTNPCGEIQLRSKEFCNLTEVVARPEDREESLLKKTKLAAILGTYQSTLTNFPYISKEWKRNCEEERLLGISITGQWDCPQARNPGTLKKMKELSIEVNKEYAKRFGINPSLSVTCVKPSGTVSQLVDAASGMHPRHSPYYIRRVRISASDPLFKMLKDQKFPYYPEVGQLETSATTYVLEFPVKAPEGAIFKNDITALDQLRYWKTVKENFTEHNPSVTISVGNDEWIKTANWVYDNWDIIGGLSFLPREDHVYQLAPYEEISEERYQELISKFPEVDFSQIVVYEKDDGTTGGKALACEGMICELDVASEAESKKGKNS
jgi:ribonucleoside-diphosphate reductase alpha chain